ncbi:MAG TPA: tripartite tricarboxylate transporter substrate binding protein [Casimicrobiaceae bacterium]|nr:tripartite tricarboxylate transporter substrate binding protein [Casimicrobiaceae bacterium]
MRIARIVASTLVALAFTAHAQYPDRPVTMVVPFPPGGVADTVARPVAEAMGAALKQPVIIENKGGAGGAIGMAQVAKAKPDGYTILMALSSLVVLPEADKVLGRTPSFLVKDLKPIARFTADPTVLVVRADSPWKTYQELVAYAKANPGKLNFGSSGNYGTMHIPMAMLLLGNDTKMTHIPFTGAGPAIIALLGGNVDVLATGPASILQHVQGGKARALAHWGEQRLTTLPDVPTLRELGVPISYAQWSGLFVPAETPEPIVARLREAAKAAGNDPKVREVLLKAGSPVLYQDADEFGRYVDADAQRMTDVVKRIGKVE